VSDWCWLRCVLIQVKVSDVGLMQAVGCGPDYYTSLLKSSLKSSIAWSVQVMSHVTLLDTVVCVTSA